MILEKFVCGRARSNAYLLAPGSGGPCVVVDPGAGAAKPLLSRIDELGVAPAALLLTHGHPDHVWSARALCDRLGIPAYLHPLDRRWILRRMRPVELVDVFGDQSLEVGGMTFRVLHTPGHTRGGVCYLTRDVCFTGDTVFARAPGHTVYPGGNRSVLQQSIETLILPLSDDVRLLPGHGPETTLGRARGSFERFVGRTVTPEGRQPWTS